MALSLKLHKKVDGFTLEVAWAIQEELAVLFGYSGAGKSMTLQMIAGLMKPDGGSIHSGRSFSTVGPESMSPPRIDPSAMFSRIWPCFRT